MSSLLNDKSNTTSPINQYGVKKSPSINSEPHCNSKMMNGNNNEFYDLLVRNQLESFWPLLRDQLQITRIEHFNYVKIKDLEKIGMSKPAIRRLLDSVGKYQKNGKYIPTRPPPPPPQTSQVIQRIGRSHDTPILSSALLSHDQINKSKLYNNNLNKTFLKNKLLNLTNNSKNNNINRRPTSVDSSINLEDDGSSLRQPVSFIINSNDIEIIKTNKGEDEVLGYGHFGIVKKAVWTTHTGSRIKVAVKCLHDNLIESEEKSHEAFIDIVNEVSNMCGMNHRNLIKLYGVAFKIDTENNVKKTFVMMITELAQYGSLLSYLKSIRQKNQSLPLSLLYSYSYQIASGMEYLESKKLIHRDLATRNILLSSPTHLKICDFGMTRSVKNGFYKMIEKHKIPCAWWPPESIKEKIFSIKSDVWMFGVTIWEIFTLGQHPWPNLNASEILKSIDIDMKRLAIPELCSNSFYSILLKCWSNNPVERPSFETIKILVKETKIIEMKSKIDYKQENRLEMLSGDKIVIIEGVASKYWWKGQNQSTLLVGTFPRAILDPQRPIISDDISMPLKNSFIHAGHMGSNSNQKSWGNPAKIDELFLNNPLNPPDLLEDLIDEPNEPVEIIEKKTESKQIDLINLLDLNTCQENIKKQPMNDQSVSITYPDKDFSFSYDSFSSYKSKSISNTSSPSLNSNNLDTHNYYNNNNFNLNDGKQVKKSTSYVNDTNDYYNYNTDSNSFSSQIKTPTEAIKLFDNFETNNQMEFLSRSEEISNGLNSLSSFDFVNNNDMNVFNSHINNNNTSQKIVNTKNPFYSNTSFSNCKNLESSTTASSLISNNSFSSNIKIDQTKFNFNIDNVNKNYNVDDYLKRVMNDVINDFNNVKFQTNS